MRSGEGVSGDAQVILGAGDIEQGDFEEQVTGMACDWSCEWSGD